MANFGRNRRRSGAVFISKLPPISTPSGSLIKTWNGIPIAQIKSINGVAIASIKTWNGITNV